MSAPVNSGATWPSSGSSSPRARKWTAWQAHSGACLCPFVSGAFAAKLLPSSSQPATASGEPVLLSLPLPVCMRAEQPSHSPGLKSRRRPSKPPTAKGGDTNAEPQLTRSFASRDPAPQELQLKLRRHRVPVGWRCATSPVSRCSPAWWWWQQSTPSGDLLPGAEKAKCVNYIAAALHCTLSLSRHEGVGGEEKAAFFKPGGAETSSGSKPGGVDT